jgi:hypothetical protein
MMNKKDNTTLREKVSLRLAMLAALETPLVLETHGGTGQIYRRCYGHLDGGTVFEKDAEKASMLAEQRSSWAVYQADCEGCLRRGVGFHNQPNFIDIDPYGECWPTIEAVFIGMKELPRRLVFAVNCGLRQKLKMNGGWIVESLAQVVRRFGNASLYRDYLNICQAMLKEKAARRGYQLSRWTGYYCGHAKHMTHFGAVLDIV